MCIRDRTKSVAVVYEEAEAAVPAKETAEPAPEPRYERRRPIERDAHVPAWLLEEEPAEVKAADGRRPTNYTRPSAYEAYENPTFVRRGKMCIRDRRWSATSLRKRRERNLPSR